MCGIIALFGSSSDESSVRKRRKDVLNSSKLLRHRGPDWNGIAAYSTCYLAHERLAIVGVQSGAQPIVSYCGSLALSVNGEIYNHSSLEQSLNEHQRKEKKVVSEFKTGSDCEVLLHLFHEYGNHFLMTEGAKINGMYAFAAYNDQTRKFVIARDPIGIIPLYIGRSASDECLWVASEIKALQDYCEVIEVFPPGHYYTGSTEPPPITPDETKGDHKGRFVPFYQPKWYSDLDYFPTNGTIDENQLLDELNSQLTVSVRRHMLSEVPYGVLLSGGLDSSLVASIAASQYKDLGNNDVLRSFCIGFKGSPDIIAAEKVASWIGTRHLSFEISIQEGLDALSDVIYHLETYDVTTIRASTPMMLLSRKIKATGCKMVLSGEGADEIFGGYLYFHKAPNKKEFHAECVRKIKKLHSFDCLRANKSTMAWGIEARVPFLDREFIEFCMSQIDPALKMCSNGKIEKNILRSAFDVGRKNGNCSEQKRPYLPEEVLWRQKEQFSDGVGYVWIDKLKAVSENSISDIQMKYASTRFPINPPHTKEAYFYREMFDKHFPSPAAALTVPKNDKTIACSTESVMHWDETWMSENNTENTINDGGVHQGTRMGLDPSGRAMLEVHRRTDLDR